MGDMELRKDSLPPELKSAYDSDLSDTMNGIQVRLPQIKVNRIEVKFVVPTSSGGQLTDELVGVILHHQRVNAYFLTLQDKRPTCFSLDSKIPEQGANLTVQAHACISCKQNQFGSLAGRAGKACKNMIRLHIFLEGENIPLRISVPPTSIAEYEQYATTLAKEFTPIIAVKTKITLQKKEKGSMIWSVATFKNVLKLNVDGWQQMRAFKQKYLESMVRQPIEVEEYQPEQTHDAADEDTPF